MDGALREGGWGDGALREGGWGYGALREGGWGNDALREGGWTVCGQMGKLYLCGGAHWVVRQMCLCDYWPWQSAGREGVTGHIPATR